MERGAADDGGIGADGHAALDVGGPVFVLAGDRDTDFSYLCLQE